MRPANLGMGLKIESTIDFKLRFEHGDETSLVATWPSTDGITSRIIFDEFIVLILKCKTVWLQKQ